MKKIIKVGSRQSYLALAQSRIIIDEVQKKYPALQFELVGIKTTGDVLLDQKLTEAGGKGLFVKELELALLEHKIDLAIHSMKDVPAAIPPGLEIRVFSQREDARDVLLTSNGSTFSDLPPKAVVGTSSLRRKFQLLERRPDLKIKELRGNINTRLKKLQQGEYDAIVLAAAGLKRAGIEVKDLYYFELKEMIPAVGQGILGIETRSGDDLSYLWQTVHSPQSARQIAAERAFMLKLGGDCTTPLAAYALVEKDKIKVYGMLATNDGKKMAKDEVEGEKEKAAQWGEELALKLKGMLF